ncbi:MAG: hypothetical protein WC845_01940 [Candidatus Staskawiczbacteria bacterium]|jgi:hypothetical protein
MKWCFLLNDAQFLPEFFGKLAFQTIKKGDECLVVMSSKIAEYRKKKFFPNEAKFISKIDWSIKNYQKGKKEFGKLSWKELFPAFDRYKSLNFNYNNSFNMVSQTYQFLEFIFQEEKPDIIISEPPAGLFHEVTYYFCKKNNIPYIGLSGSRFNDRIDIYDSEFTFSKYEKTFREIKNVDLPKKEKKFAENFIEKFISHRYKPFYIDLIKIYFSQIGIIKHYVKKFKGLKPLFKYFLNRKYFKDFDYENEAHLKHAVVALWKIEKRQFRILFQKNIFSKISNDDKDFFFFPLQYQPEASTSVYATYYCDQLSTIRNIAFALPFPYRLYVKEHPASVGLRPRSFYKKIKKLPNVVLISPQEDTERIVKSSSGVITITSTIGMEAILAGKPAYVLGNMFYSYHPLCRSPKNFEELKEKIEEDLVKKPDTENIEDINIRFIASYFRNTIEGNIISASMGEDENNYELIYREIKNYSWGEK